ncbi:MAG TPA: nuclease A inhibitor family protein [Pyrinomonadaceae bacterium]|nr:nuclease A inhibitor family protein [Pyrinomonadaceae bacterium]
MKEITTRRLSSSALQEQLEEICKNLIYISETDSPVRPFMDSKIESITSNSVARALGRVSLSQLRELIYRSFSRN